MISKAASSINPGASKSSSRPLIGLTELNLLYLCQRLPFPPNKGEKIRTFHQITHLRERGHEVTVCAPCENASDRIQAHQFSDRYGVKVFLKFLGNRPVRYFRGLLTRKPLSVAHFHAAPLQNEVDRLLESSNYSHIVCSSSSMAEYVFTSRALKRAQQQPRIAMDFMDLDSDKWRQYAAGSSPLSPMKAVYAREARLLARYEAAIYREFDLSLFISEDEVEQFRRVICNHEKLHSIGNGIDCEAFPPSPKMACGKPPTLLFTGVMDYRPNIDAVLWFHSSVWPRLTERMPGVKLVIAGMNPVDDIRELASDAGITVTGFIEDILPCFHQADIFIAPIRIARGVQNKVLQAFACKLPVVSTPTAASGIDCTPNRHLLLAQTAEQFLAQIAKLVEDEERYAALGREALDLIRNRYTWGKVLEDFIRLLEN